MDDRAAAREEQAAALERITPLPVVHQHICADRTEQRQAAR